MKFNREALYRMRTSLVMLVAVLTCELTLAQDKKLIWVNDFENKPPTEAWWRHNGNVKFSYDDQKNHQPDRQSKACLYIRWDSTQGQKPFTWFTDLKADTLAAEGMDPQWKLFRQNTWLSFWCRGGDGDTLMLNYLVLSKGHSSKWGAVKMIPVVEKKWKFYKIRFEDLQYENWGRVVADFDLNTDIGRCFEVGLRSASTTTKGYIEAWFDNIKLTNYEPFE